MSRVSIFHVLACAGGIALVAGCTAAEPVDEDAQGLVTEQPAPSEQLRETGLPDGQFMDDGSFESASGCRVKLLYCYDPTWHMASACMVQVCNFAEAAAIATSLCKQTCGNIDCYNIAFPHLC